MQLPDRPNLRHLRDQAKDLVRSGAAPTLADAQFLIARKYGFPSWPKLKQHVESLEEIGQLKQAIAANDVARVQELLTSSPELRQVLIDDVPLMAVAQPGRIPMMELLVRHGADVNGLCWGWFPVLFTPCENLEPEPLRWLLDHGADPNRGNPKDLARNEQHCRVRPRERTYAPELDGTRSPCRTHATRRTTDDERARWGAALALPQRVHQLTQADESAR